MNYFERYEAGEHEAVWSELRDKGAALFDGPDLEDARRVASTTMLRVASNLARIAAALRGFGYEFVTVGPPPVEIASINVAVRASATEALLSHPGLGPEQVRQMLASLPQLLGGPVDNAPTASRDISVRPSALGDPNAFAQEVAAYEEIAGPIPLSLAAFWRFIGLADFTCRQAGGEPLLGWHPLVVMPPEGLVHDRAEWAFEGDDPIFLVDLIPDPVANDGHGGDLICADMSPGIDCRLGNGEWFVDHLRRGTRAACFPGLDPDGRPPFIEAIAARWDPF